MSDRVVTLVQKSSGEPNKTVADYLEEIKKLNDTGHIVGIAFAVDCRDAPPRTFVHQSGGSWIRLCGLAKVMADRISRQIAREGDDA